MSIYFDTITEYADDTIRTLPIADLNQIESAIRSLDGFRRSGVLLQNSKLKAEMGIGGGRQNHYYVHAVLPNLEVFEVCGEAAADDEFSMQACGQWTDFLLCDLTDLQTAVSAALHFAHTGNLLETLKWRSRGTSAN